MSVTKFAFLPPNSAGATLCTNFLWLCAKYIPSWCLLLQHPSPCSCTSERRPPNCQTQLLGYWCQFMTVFETMQEEEIKILSPLFLITDCETSSYKLLMGGTVLEAWAYCVPRFTSWELKPLSISSKLCLHIFYLASPGRETQDFGQQQF